jgi:AraC-like DNA-binding protein
MTEVNRSQIIPLILTHLRARGLDTSELVARFGLLTAEVSPEVEAPLPKLYLFLDEAERLAADPFLGVHVAESRAVGTYGLLEYAWRNAPTVAASMAYAAENWSIFGQSVSELQFTRNGAGATLERRVPGAKLGAGRHGNEFFVVTTLLQMRELTGDPFVPTRAFFSHPRPKDVSELERVCGTTELAFDRPSTGLEFATRLADLPNRKADPKLFELLSGYVAKLNAPTPSEQASAFVTQLEAAVRIRLPHGEPTLAALASACAMSERTLQRRLASENTSLMKVIEKVRESEATRILKAEQDVPLADLATRIGYQDTRSLIRAFKRWTGTTPRAYRAQAPA